MSDATNVFDFPSSDPPPNYPYSASPSAPAMKGIDVDSSKYIDAKLKALEATLETKVQRIEAKIDQSLDDSAQARLDVRQALAQAETDGKRRSDETRRFFILGLTTALTLFGLALGVFAVINDQRNTWLQLSIQKMSDNVRVPRKETPAPAAAQLPATAQLSAADIADAPGAKAAVGSR